MSEMILGFLLKSTQPIRTQPDDDSLHSNSLLKELDCCQVTELSIAYMSCELPRRHYSVWMVLSKEGERWERRTGLTSGESWHLERVGRGVDMAGSLPLIGEDYISNMNMHIPSRLFVISWEQPSLLSSSFWLFSYLNEVSICLSVIVNK